VARFFCALFEFNAAEQRQSKTPARKFSAARGDERTSGRAPRGKISTRTTPSLRFHRKPIGSVDEKRFCHAAAATHGVNEVTGIRQLQLIVAAHRPDSGWWYHHDKFATHISVRFTNRHARA
jgi:hypothetical protein